MSSQAPPAADVDALYRAPYGEFIAERNALAARLRAGQDRAAAAAVKALAKPSGTAWTVNQLFWRHPREFERLMNTGSALRVAQQARLAGHDGADVLAAVAARDKALAALMARVPDLLAEAGVSAGAAMRQRVAITLEALSIYGGLDAGPRAGRLTVDVDPPGFAALATLVPPGRGPTPRRPARSVSPTDANTGHGEGAPTPPRPRQADSLRVAEAKSAFVRAKADADEARLAAKAADTARRRADAAWQQAKTAAAEAQQELDAALKRTSTAEARRDEAIRAAESAREAAARAERLRDEAERTYRTLVRR
jgi:hypothetical protein